MTRGLWHDKGKETGFMFEPAIVKTGAVMTQKVFARVSKESFEATKLEKYLKLL